MNNNEMYYGYQGFMPLANNLNNNGIPLQSYDNNFTVNYYGDLYNRIDKLERQIKRIDQRLTRIETPYANNNYNNEPDDNMYMM